LRGRDRRSGRQWKRGGGGGFDAGDADESRYGRGKICRCGERHGIGIAGVAAGAVALDASAEGLLHVGNGAGDFDPLMALGDRIYGQPLAGEPCGESRDSVAGGTELLAVLSRGEPVMERGRCGVVDFTEKGLECRGLRCRRLQQEEHVVEAHVLRSGPEGSRLRGQQRGGVRQGLVGRGLRRGKRGQEQAEKHGRQPVPDGKASHRVWKTLVKHSTAACCGGFCRLCHLLESAVCNPFGPQQALFGTVSPGIAGKEEWAFRGCV